MWSDKFEWLPHICAYLHCSAGDFNIGNSPPRLIGSRGHFEQTQRPPSALISDTGKLCVRKYVRECVFHKKDLRGGKINCVCVCVWKGGTCAFLRVAWREEERGAVICSLQMSAYMYLSVCSYVLSLLKYTRTVLPVRCVHVQYVRTVHLVSHGIGV